MLIHLLPHLPHYPTAPPGSGPSVPRACHFRLSGLRAPHSYPCEGQGFAPTLNGEIPEISFLFFFFFLHLHVKFSHQTAGLKHQT